MLIRASLAPQTLTASSFRDLRKKRQNMDKGRNEQERRGKRIPAVKRKMQATADDQWRITRMKTKLHRHILADQVMIEVVNRFDLQAKLLSFMGISHSKLGELGDFLERAGRPPSEVDEIISLCDRHLTNLVRTASVGEDAAAEEEDAERKKKYADADADAAEDNDPAAEEEDAAADTAEYMWW
ncbi:hypothetical protein EJB05_34562, partial [Eragrostis curvula]